MIEVNDSVFLSEYIWAYTGEPLLFTKDKYRRLIGSETIIQIFSVTFECNHTKYIYWPLGDMCISY